jgi:hypothetical protein
VRSGTRLGRDLVAKSIYSLVNAPVTAAVNRGCNGTVRNRSVAMSPQPGLRQLIYLLLLGGVHVDVGQFVSDDVLRRDTHIRLNQLGSTDQGQAGAPLHAATPARRRRR